MKGKNGRKKYEQIRSEGGGGGGPKWYEYYITLIHMCVSSIYEDQKAEFAEWPPEILFNVEC